MLGLGEQQEQNNNKAQSLTACVCARVYVCVCGHWLFLFVYATPGAHVSTSLTNVCLTPRVALCQPHTHTHKRRQQHIENVAQGNQLKLKPHTYPPPLRLPPVTVVVILLTMQNKTKKTLAMQSIHEEVGNNMIMQRAFDTCTLDRLLVGSVRCYDSCRKAMTPHSPLSTLDFFCKLFQISFIQKRRPTARTVNTLSM